MAEEALPSAGRARYRESFRVRRYETDPAGWATVRTLCQLLQEAATGHATRLDMAVDTLIDGGLAWVLSRLKVDVARWPRCGEEVTVETWPHAASRLMVERRFRVEGDAGELATATTLWVVLDLERRRPMRLPPFILDGLRGIIDADAQPLSPTKVPPLEGAEECRRFEVRLADLDMVRHVNNAHYPQWAVEAAPEDLWAGHRPAELDVHFLGECHLGDAVISESRRLQDAPRPSLLHRLLRNDGDEVARATTVWMKVPTVEVP